MEWTRTGRTRTRGTCAPPRPCALSLACTLWHTGRHSVRVLYADGCTARTHFYSVSVSAWFIVQLELVVAELTSHGMARVWAIRAASPDEVALCRSEGSRCTILGELCATARGRWCRKTCRARSCPARALCQTADGSGTHASLDRSSSSPLGSKWLGKQTTLLLCCCANANFPFRCGPTSTSSWRCWPNSEHASKFWNSDYTSSLSGLRAGTELMR